MTRIKLKKGYFMIKEHPFGLRILPIKSNKIARIKGFLTKSVIIKLDWLNCT